ncbi:alginate export family protein [Endozoicomonas numazuensis]|uniref:alginate export family protein n=1 Tax=Endozoicomonas numazuensis TaxID=1137799 RepID=UPI00191C62A8|nr:alginate export family protein [Endozoicomonas numazuensis]
MKHTKVTLLSAAISGMVAVSPIMTQADEFIDAIKEGEVSGDFRLRYETVDQDNNLKDAKALTLRSRLGYQTGDFFGFSGMLEFEDVRSVFGVNKYNDSVGNGTEYSIIPDPAVTELDQAFLQFKMEEEVTARLGRQVINYDNQRFIGDVGWRQDRQTFDAFTVDYMPVKGLSLQYGFINKRNRVFAEDKDLDSKDHLFNASYLTPVGKLTGYAYLLEMDNHTNNSLDTYGIRFAGSTDASDLKFLYTAEYASQKNKSDIAKYDASYYFAEGGVDIYGITVKVGYEVLGSDDGKYGFSTPLATAHKFNGWADQFLDTPVQGLKDLYGSLGGDLFAGQWSAVYHDFKADEDTPAIKDLGKEIDLLYSRKFGKHYNAGIKYARYSAGDKASGKVDTNKFWLWVGLTF